MSHKHRSTVRRAKAIDVLAASVIFAMTSTVCMMAPAAAQSVAPAPPSVSKATTAKSKGAEAPGASANPGASAKKNPEVALKAYGSGTRAYESGKMTDAVEQLSTALTAGGLPSNQMAKALYYRGAAYRKQGKPALAISDLTSALWLKGGLSDADRALATDARQGAYREAGLGDTAPAVPAQQNAAVAQTAAPVAAAPVAAAPVAAAPVPAPTPEVASVAAPAANGAAASWKPATTVAASEPITTLGTVPDPIAPVRVASATPAPVDNSLSSAVTASSASVAPPAAPVPSADTAVVMSAVPSGDVAAAPTASPLAGAGQAVSGFFNNMGSSIGKMFSSGGEAASQATQTASSPVMTSSTGPVYASTADTNAAASGWGDAKIISPNGAKAGTTQTAAVQPAQTKPTLARAAGGGILLQVAAVRSRDEANLVVSKLQGTPAVKSAAAGTQIDEAVIGNMGTFYRVRLGPFASAAEPNKLCASLKPEGYDCLVVSQ